MNISEIGRPITIIFYLKHYRGSGKAALGFAADQIRTQAKRKNMCVSCYISKKIRVGRSLLIFFYFKFLFFIFPNFTKKHNKCVVCMKYITKIGLFGLFTYNIEWMSYCKGIS